MAETTKRISAIFTVKSDEFNRSLTDMNKQIKLTQSELKLAGSSIKEFGKDSKNLTDKQKALEQQIKNVNGKMKLYGDSVKKNTDSMQKNRKELEELKRKKTTLNAKLKESIKLNGEEAEETKKLKEELDKTNTAYKKKEQQLKQNVNAINKHTTELNKNETELNKLQGELSRTNAELDKNNNKWLNASKNLEKNSEKLKAAGSSINQVGNNILKLTVPLAVAGGAALKVSADFEQGMKEVQAISGATGNDLEKLKEKAKEMGATTKFSASESAEALKYMSMAGWKTEQMLGGLPGIMNLAAASGEELGLVSDICTDAMTAFGLEASKSTHFADILAAASSNANTNVNILGESFKYVAPLCGSLGYTAEDTAVYLGLMANAGIKGSQAGTTLKTALVNMAKPTKNMNIVMKRLGISITDNEGNMKSLKDVMDNIRGSFKNLTEDQKASAGAALFGKESLAGMLAVINASEQDYNKLSAAINNCDGVAQNMANTMNDSLQGQITLLKSQLEGVGIQLGEILVPIAKDFVASLSNMVDWFSKLSPETQENIVKFAGLGLAAGGALKIVGGGISTIGSIAGGLGKLTKILGTATTATSVAGTAAGVAGGVGGLGAMAAGLGGVALAAAPYALAIGGVILAGKAVHDNMSKEVVPSIDLFADKVTTTYETIETAQGTMQVATQQNTITITEETKKQVQAYLDLDQQATQSLNNLYINSSTITAQQCSELTAQYEQMSSTITTGLEADKQENLKQLNDFFAQSKAIADKEEQDILAKTNSFYDNKKKTVDDYSKQITDILEEAKNKNRQITDAERHQINNIQKEMKEQAVKTLSENEVEAQVILQRMKDYDGRVTAEQCSQHITKLNESRDKAVSVANDEYDKRVATIVKLRDEAKVISAEQAKALIEDAKKTKDETVRSVETTRIDAINKMRLMNSELDDEVDTGTGKILTKWDKLKRWWNGWQPEQKSFSYTVTEQRRRVILDNPDRYSSTGGLLTGSDYVGISGLYNVNELGWELFDSRIQTLSNSLAYVPSGTRVTNHAMSTMQMRRDIEKEVDSQMNFSNKKLIEEFKEIFKNKNLGKMDLDLDINIHNNGQGLTKREIDNHADYITNVVSKQYNKLMRTKNLW